MTSSKRGNRRQRTPTSNPSAVPAQHARRSRQHDDGALPPSEEDDALPVSLTFDVDASREPPEAEGIVDDYPRIDGERPGDVDELDAVDRHRSR